MCDCIERLEKLLTEKMLNDNPGAEVEEPVSFQNTMFLFNDEKGISVFLKNPVLGKYKIGNRVRKWEISFIPLYCPYCGEKLGKEEE
ncbi:MAG: hypothetical protein LBQ28_04700 [Prevotellaceae bacterium]|jgi:hypothetical protein|nr:hypothetical protein [Prevotellaceae bacterium]